MLQLLLPIIFPSWRFFSSVDGAARIEYGFSQKGEEPTLWSEFRPRPGRLSWRQSLLRLVHNPQWNEYLYMISCAEHLLSEVDAKRVEEIFRRLQQACRRGEFNPPATANFISFRLHIVERQGDIIVANLAFIAGPRPLTAGISYPLEP